MSDGVAIALVSAVSALLVAGFGYLGVLAQQTKKLAHESKTQVTNSHTTNFRDDVTAIAKAQTEQGEVLNKLSENQDIIHGSLTQLWNIVNSTPTKERKRWSR